MKMTASERLKEYWRQVRSGERPAPSRGHRDTSILARRRVRCQSNWVRSGELEVVILRHGEFTFKEPRKRATYKLTLAEAYRRAVEVTTLRIMVRVKELKKTMPLKAARRQARKESGL